MVAVDSSSAGPQQLEVASASGFVLEIPTENAARARDICKLNDIELIKIGETTGKTLTVRRGKNTVINLPIRKLKYAWCGGIPEAMR